ncbi:MAG: flagellar biosynthetic protein FliO, partial [Desulfobacteraceae bacterium]|nr:flagellar biosynthetic protein FliO [Desulfobacteraceae bacterium]
MLLLLLAAVVGLAVAMPLLGPAAALAQETPAGHLRVAGSGRDLQQTASLFVTMLKAFGALALVLGLIALLAVWLRKMGWGKDAPGRGGSLIRVLDTRMLAPKKYVAVLRIADEYLAVGITDQQINLLTKLEP